MGTGGGGFQENMGKFGWDTWWIPAYVAQSGVGWENISEYYYGSTDSACWQGLAENNGSSGPDWPLDVGQVVGLPAIVGTDAGGGGTQYDIICANVPAQQTLGVVTAPGGFGTQAVPVCGFTHD